MKKLLALGFLGALGAATGAHAAAISGVVANASSEAVGLDRFAARAVDGSGTNFSSGLASVIADGTMWLSGGDTGNYGPADPSPSIIFNLGAVYNVGDVNIWNYNEAGMTARGIASADVLTSTDGLTYSLLESINLAQAPGLDSTDFHQTVSLNTKAQYVELTNLGSFTGDDEEFKGLSEVQFFTAADVAPVSEPASFAVLGIGLVGLVVARKYLTA